MGERDERTRTTAAASLPIASCQHNRRHPRAPGAAWRPPPSWPWGVRWAGGCLCAGLGYGTRELVRRWAGQRPQRPPREVARPDPAGRGGPPQRSAEAGEGPWSPGGGHACRDRWATWRPAEPGGRGGRRQPAVRGTRSVTGDRQARCCESLGGPCPGATRRVG